MSTEYELDIENDINKIEVPPGVTVDQETLEAVQESMKDVAGCWSRGPLKLCWSLNGTTLTVSASVFGVTIGRFVLSPSKPCARISINLWLVSGYIELCFKNSCLVLNGKVCKLGSCARFNNLRVVCF